MVKIKNYCMSLAHLIEQNAKMWSNSGRMNLKKNTKNYYGYDDFLVLDVIFSYKQADIEFISKVICKQKTYIEKITLGLKDKKFIKEDTRKYRLTTEGKRIYEDLLYAHNKLAASVERFFTENDIKTLYRLQHKLQTVMMSLCNSDLI